MWEIFGKPMLTKSNTHIGLVLGDYTIVEASIELPIFINNSNVLHKFYVIKPRKMMSPIILRKT